MEYITEELRPGRAKSSLYVFSKDYHFMLTGLRCRSSSGARHSISSLGGNNPWSTKSAKYSSVMFERPQLTILWVLELMMTAEDEKSISRHKTKFRLNYKPV